MAIVKNCIRKKKKEYELSLTIQSFRSLKQKSLMEKPSSLSHLARIDLSSNLSKTQQLKSTKYKKERSNKRKRENQVCQRKSCIMVNPKNDDASIKKKS